MSRTKINVSAVINASQQIKTAKKYVSSAKSSFTQMKTAVDSKIKKRANISGRMNTVQRQLLNIESRIGRIQTTVQSGANRYKTADDKVESMRGQIKANIAAKAVSGATSKWENYFKSTAQEIKNSTFVKELKKNYGMKEALAGSGYIGEAYGYIEDIKSAKGWYDYADTAYSFFSKLPGAVKTWKNYRKIGNAVGVNKSTAWWLKNITGLKPLGRTSTASTWLKRFGNNLTNKTSPFAAELKNIGKNFTGANGVGKAVSSWGAVAATGAINYFGNKQEQEESNGTMSNARVVAETVTETAIDTAITLGSAALVGAAVGASTTVALPGVAVTAAVGLVVAGVNAGIQACTGKTATEWLSDTVLDTGEAVLNSIGKAANNVKNAVGSWFKKIRFV